MFGKRDGVLEFFYPVHVFRAGEVVFIVECCVVKTFCRLWSREDVEYNRKLTVEERMSIAGIRSTRRMMSYELIGMSRIGMFHSTAMVVHRARGPTRYAPPTN